MTQDFQYIDDSNVPPSIKPMVLLHDKLVRGYYKDKDINLPKLIIKMEDSLKEQVVEMTKIEEQTQFVSLRLVKVLHNIRKLIDEPCGDYRQGLIELLDSSCNEIEKKYKR